MAALLLAVLPPCRLAAQFTVFGQNKVQYRTLEWRIAKGPHVDLYFYPEEAALAPTVLKWAEETYDSLALRFSWELTQRVPLIVYASHSDFEQTNVLPFVPPEGILGVTDFLKHRVTLPFRGNYAEFRATLRHEMVHVFQLALLNENYARTLRSSGAIVPLWWSEGLAEHWSGGQDARDEMVLRDLVVSGRLPKLPEMEFITSAIIYPIGGKIHDWLASRYGEWRPAQLYRELWRYETFDDAIVGVYGKSLAQLDAEYQVAMRRAYLPVVAARSSSSTLGQVLVRGAVKPALSFDSAGESRVVYYTAPNGYVELASRRLDGRGKHTLIRSGRSGDLAAFHPFESRVDASRPAYLLAGTRVDDRDALMVWDVEHHKVVGRYQFPGLVSVVSPAWLPGDSAVVFSGLTFDGISDLYRFTFRGERLERLTHDHYQDLDPSPSPDGREVVFSSDRGPHGMEGAMNLYLLDLASGAVRSLTDGRWVDESPRWASNGRIYYSSSRDSVLNVFSIDRAGGSRRETSSWTGAYDPTWVPGRDAILAGTFEGLSFNVALFRPDSQARADSAASSVPPADTAVAGRWDWPAGQAEILAAQEPAPYKSNLALDIGITSVAYNPGRYTAPGAAALLSDLLGDHIAFVTASTYVGTGIGGVFDNMNLTTIYFDQDSRVNWGVGAFRTKGFVYEVNQVVDYKETTAGAFALIRYPFSRFTRADASLTLEFSDRFDFTLPVAEPHRRGLIATQAVSYVFDNSAWNETGPIDGQRFGLTASLSNDLSSGRFDGWFASGDWRAYLRTSRQSAFATRALAYYAGGARPRRINIGGSLGVRGFPWYGYVSGSRAFMVNEEFRFQVLDRLILGFPVADFALPGVQGAFFADAGSATTPGSPTGPILTSRGFSWRMGLGGYAVLRLDMGKRRVYGDPAIYGLSSLYKSGGFVNFFFGYNY
ncbi:MAG: PD40 domain-containing protein [Gemmatimonadetes bacterium]|nr:PD40 domain-containing protein [Gemmatimonadota bacterium]